MKQTLLFVFALFTVQVFAQAELSFDFASVDVLEAADESDIEGRIIITNDGTESVDLLWRRVVDDLPAEWDSWVCDANLCYTPATFTCPENKPVTIAPGAAAPMYAHVDPNDFIGEGTFEIELFTTTDTTVIATLVYNFTTSEPTSTYNPGLVPSVQVYPNPAVSYVKLKNDRDVSRVVFYNIIGKEVLAYNHEAGGSHSVGMLPSGMYLVGMYDRNGKTIKTIRMSKQSVRP